MHTFYQFMITADTITDSQSPSSKSVVLAFQPPAAPSITTHVFMYT